MILKEKDKIKVTIENLDYKGDGISKVDNYFIFTPGLLYNEEALIEIVKVKKGFAVGRTIEIYKKSEDRINSTSPFGSINLSHLSFSKQLQWQKDITKQTFDKVLKANFDIENTITDNNMYNYRNKVVFHCVYKPNLKLALYANNNQRLMVVNDFMLAAPNVNNIIAKLNESNILIKNKDLINIIFKNNSKNELLITLVSLTKGFPEIDKLIDFFKQFKEVKGITLNLKKHKEKILSNKSILLYGENILTENMLLINDQSFMQVNYGVANLVYELIKENIYGTNILDAYSGVGSISFNIYNDINKITMIDNNKENIKLAKIIRDDSKYNFNYKNIDIILANAEDVINNYRPDTIIVDPPRKGLDDTLINEVINNNINRVIYLSCDLQTLVRDLKIFNNYYEINKVYPIKMFPQTNSFETLVILTKKDIK